MKKILVTICLMLVVLNMTAQKETTSMTNPVIFADVPDLDIRCIMTGPTSVATALRFLTSPLF